MSSKSHLHHCISAFAGELSSFVQRAQDSFNALKRTVEQRPQAGVQDFKECLDDLEQQVADFTDEVQQLVDCTSESISFEELIGHCTAVYLNNRQAALALEQHLSQYGYQQAPGTVVEPEHPDTLVVADDGFNIDLHMNRVNSRAGLGPLSSLDQQRGSYSTPTSPVTKSVLGSSKYAPSRLGMSQPVSPLATYKASAAAAATTPWTSTGACNFSTLGTVGPRAAAPLTELQTRTAATACQPFTQSKHDRNSLGAVSNTSSTPAGLLISPGVAALANKYATSSVGGSSVGAMSMPDQPSTAPLGSETRSPCRDLSLSLSLANNTSPDLPIFGLTPASSASLSQFPLVQHQQQVCNQPQASSNAAADSNPAPAAAAGVAGGRGGNSTEDDTTGELYSSLIHSNFTGRSRQSQDDRMQTDQEPITPLCAAQSCPSSPRVPNTAGRLPTEWHSQKIQELENLQADLTFTLSQMKRTPSRSRLSMLAAADRDDDGAGHSSNTDQGQQLQQQEQQKVKQRRLGFEQEAGSNQRAEQQQQQQPRMEKCLPQTSAHVKASGLHAEAAAGTGTAMRCTVNNVTASSAASSKPQQEQHRTVKAEGLSVQLAVNKQSSCAGKASTAEAAASAPAAVAKAATADLESLMASLSMKYGTAVGAAVNKEASENLIQKRATATSDSVEAQPTGESGTPTDATPAPAYSPAAPGPNGLTADETSLIMKYAAAATSTSGQCITAAAATAGSEEADQLLPLSSKSPDKRSKLAARAAAAGRSVVNLSVASTASEGADLRHSAASSSSTTSGLSGRPPLAAELVAGMAAWRNAVYMDCPSPLSSISPASEQGVAAAAAAAVSSPSSLAAVADSTLPIEQKTISTIESPASFADGAATPEMNDNDPRHVGVGGSSLLTPATQVAIRQAVEAAGLSTAANRPKSSIRRLQPTTNMTRLEEMRGQLVTLHRGLVSQSFDQVYHHQQQQQQRMGLAENLESRLAGVAVEQESNCSSIRSQGVAKDDQQQQQKEQQKPDMLLSLRKQKEHVAAAVLQKQIQQAQKADRELTPRAARLLRRQQQQQEQQEQQPERQQSRRVGGAVLRSVENTAGHNPSHSQDTQYTTVTLKAKAPAAADGADLSGSSVKKGSSGSRKDAAVAAALVKAKPVSEEEFASLPGWCKGLLSVQLLNSALGELSQMMSGRSSKKLSSSDGFTAADLELLGHSSSKSKTIVSCLHKLNRATLQRSAAGSNVYKLTGTVV